MERLSLRVTFTRERGHPCNNLATLFIEILEP